MNLSNDAKPIAPVTTGIMVIISCAAIRLFVLILLNDNMSTDVDNYREIANNVRNHQVYGLNTDSDDPRAVAFRPPLYPILLAYTSPTSEVSNTQVIFLHWMLGIWMIVIVYALAQSAGIGHYGLIAVVGVTLDPILVNQSSQIMTETLAVFLAVVSILFLSKDLTKSTNQIGAGLSLGLAALCRPTFFVFAAFSLLWLLVRKQDSIGSRIKQCLLITLSMIAVITPWLVRNYNLHERPILATTHGGYTLLLANNPLFYDYIRSDASDTPWTAAEFDIGVSRFAFSDDAQVDFWSSDLWNMRAENNVIERSEVELDAFTYKVAWHYISSRPADFAYAVLFRLGRFWQFTPNVTGPKDSLRNTWLRMATGIWYATWSLAALISIFMIRDDLSEPIWRIGLCMLLAFCLVHAFYWTDMRMRAPILPIIYLLAAAGHRKRVES